MLTRLYKSWRLPAKTAGTMLYWDRWHFLMRNRYPIRYFLQYTLPLQWSIYVARPLKESTWWLRYRTTHRNHILKLESLHPGYHDSETILLHSSFQVLCDHVEIGLGWKNHQWHENRMSPLIKCGWLPNEWLRDWLAWRLYTATQPHRQPQAGLDYLNWEMTDPNVANTPQGTNARKINDLYHWWVVERPARINPWSYDAIWREVQEQDAASLKAGEPIRMFGKSTPERDLAGQIATETEELHRCEDDQMLHRLIDVRNALWS